MDRGSFAAAIEACSEMMYRVETYAVRNAEAEMNKMAMEGWRVISVCPNQAAGYGVIVTYEKAV